MEVSIVEYLFVTGDHGDDLNWEMIEYPVEKSEVDTIIQLQFRRKA